MKKFIFILVATFSFLLSTIAWAQVQVTVKSDSTEWDEFEAWKSPMKRFNITSPTLQIFWGTNSSVFDESAFAGKLAKVNNIQINMGSTTEKEVISKEHINRYKYNGIFLNLYNDSYGSGKTSPSEFSTNAIQFGFNDVTGYGYQLGENSSLILFVGGGIEWTKLDYKQPSDSAFMINHFADYSKNLTAFNFYDNVFRFGQNFESGIRLKIIKPLAIVGSYERELIFPRHLFFQWILSEAVEGIANSIIDKFSKEVIKSSPIAGPIVFFALKTGLSYGYYELRKSKMNWPFNSAMPMQFETFKVGMSFEF